MKTTAKITARRVAPGRMIVTTKQSDHPTQRRAVRYDVELERGLHGKAAVIRWAEAGFPLRYFDRPGGPVLRVPKEIP